MCILIQEELNKALLNAVKRGKTEEVKRLVRTGADVNAADEDGFSALYSAALGGKTEVMKYLIAAGAKTNKEALDGMTELHIASALNQLIKFGSGQRRLGR